MPEISARQIGTTALRILGVAAAEMPISADMAQSALEALNTLLDSWATERLLTWTRPKLPLVLVPGQAVYTWGEPDATTTPDIPHPVPVRLEMCLLSVQDTPPGHEWEIEIVSQEDFEGTIALKRLESSYASCVYLERSLPYAQLHIWPIPTLGYTLFLLPWTAHAPYEHWDHAISWPHGYQRAMTWGLACELGPQYGVEPSPTIMRIAEDSKRAIFPINVEVGRLSLTPGRPRGGTPYGYPRSFLTGR